MKKLNLQLFANLESAENTMASATPTYLNTNVTTDSGLAGEMRTYYDMNLLQTAQPNLVHEQFGQKRPIPAGGGKTINFRKFTKLAKATTPLVEGITPNGKKLEMSTKEATVSQYGDYITQSDVLELTALDNTILEATKVLGSQAGRTLDTVVRDVLQGTTNRSFADHYSGTTALATTKRSDLDSNSVITVEQIQRVVAKLRASDISPMSDGKYVAIVHPYIAYDLMRDEEWIESHKYAQPENLYTGEIGSIGGVRFVQTTEAKIFDGKEVVLGKDGSGNDLNYLTLNGAITAGAKTTFNFDGITVEADALIGKFLNVGGVIVKVTDNTTTAVTFDSTTLPAVADNTKIYAAPSAAGSVFSTLFIGENAYGTTEVTGGGLQTIVKQKGSAGTADPLDQRSSIGWKALKTAEILDTDAIVAFESVSPRFSLNLQGN